MRTSKYNELKKSEPETEEGQKRTKFLIICNNKIHSHSTSNIFSFRQNSPKKFRFASRLFLVQLEQLYCIQII